MHEFLKKNGLFWRFAGLEENLRRLDGRKHVQRGRTWFGASDDVMIRCAHPEMRRSFSGKIGMRHIKTILLLLGLLMVCLSRAQSQQQSFDANDGVVTGSLMELRAKRRVFLLVSRSVVIDTRGQAESILKEVYRHDPVSPQRFARTYNTIAGKLNKYMSKYGGISAARSISEAEFIVFFNLLEYRRPFGQPYPYGEMFVILNDSSGIKRPHIIWKTRKSPVWAEDAINEFIKDLKATRGEG